MGDHAFDQFTMWKCCKCGCEGGFDSWNKAVWDGPGFQSVEEIPNPWIIGCECWGCGWPCVVMYGTPDDIPRAIYGPGVDDGYGYEDGAMAQIEADPSASILLEPSIKRTSDWSRGCLAAKSQMQ